EAADRGIAGLRLARQIVQDILAVIRSERDGAVIPTSLPPPGLLLQSRLYQGNHIGVAAEMLCLVERARRAAGLPRYVAKVQEMHPITQPLHHAGQIVISTYTQRTRAQRYPVCRQIDGFH